MKFSRIKSGISLVEVIIVLAISVLLFVVVAGVFSFRERSSRDTAARQVMGEISRVRNEAQQGVGPTTSEGRALLGSDASGNGTTGTKRLFGQAVEFDNDKLIFYKLMIDESDNISAYETSTYSMPNGLKWYIEPNSLGCDVFNSCYKQPDQPFSDLGSSPAIDLTTDSNIILVFRNNTGQSYAFKRMSGGASMELPASWAPLANQLANYTLLQQGEIRLGFAFPGVGGTSAAQFANAPVQYYARFNLIIPNNQSLEVVK